MLNIARAAFRKSAAKASDRYVSFRSQSWDNFSGLFSLEIRAGWYLNGSQWTWHELRHACGSNSCYMFLTSKPCVYYCFYRLIAVEAARSVSIFTSAMASRFFSRPCFCILLLPFCNITKVQLSTTVLLVFLQLRKLNAACLFSHLFFGNGSIR